MSRGAIASVEWRLRLAIVVAMLVIAARPAAAFHTVFEAVVRTSLRTAT
jgi:hypothetical protein